MHAWEALNGCDTCGAHVRRDDRACPICGAVQPAGRKARIPMRRYGVVPPYPQGGRERFTDDSPRQRRRERRHNPWAYALAAVSVGVLAACARFLFA